MADREQTFDERSAEHYLSEALRQLEDNCRLLDGRHFDPSEHEGNREALGELVAERDRLRTMVAVARTWAAKLDQEGIRWSPEMELWFRD